jgi:hypothetical protein
MPQILAGRVTAMDREARTLRVGDQTFTLKPDVRLTGIQIGASVSVLFEQAADGVLVAIELVRLTF